MSAFQIRHHHNLAPRAKSVQRKVRSQPLKKNKQVYHPVSSVCTLARTHTDDPPRPLPPPHTEAIWRGAGSPTSISSQNSLSESGWNHVFVNTPTCWV